MKLNCKVWPLQKPHAAFPHDTFEWGWIINVKLIHKHSPPTTWFEAFIDSGSPWCLFHANFCRSIGIQLEKGVRDDLSGIVGGPSAPVYFHKVKVCVGSWSFDTTAGFSDALSVAGILGRHGFFESFSVKFDPTDSPPSVELQRINRA